MFVRTYDLFLDLDFKNLKFGGRALIGLESEKDVVLNSVDLNILNVNADGQPLQFEQNRENLVVKTGPFSGALEVKYTGSISDTLVGIYRAPYNNTYMVTTQFEAAHASRMFPCVDHPGYKAEFKLTLRIDRGLDAISNMPVESVNIEGDKKVVSFKSTPRMSTYLLYLGVGKFEEVKDRVGDVDLIVATPPGKSGKGKFGLEVAKGSMEFYDSYFGMPYVLPKVHLVSIPEFAAGAMENWGAVTFRETALHIDESSGVRARKRVADTVAHELAHMWFGDLVTMRWWDDVWLNESFATFMSYKVVDALYPRWEVWQDFLRTQTAGAMVRDSLRNTHPIKAEVESPSEIEQIFDDISYGKGGSVLRMIELYVGSEGFREGIKSYLARYKFSNASGEDLWNSLEESSGKQIRMMLTEWIGKPGYPVITATVSGEKLILRQERFLLSGASEEDVWPIPLTMKLDGECRRLLLNKEEEVIDIDGVKSLNLNVDRTGFYRVHYGGLYDLVWRSELSALDRWGIIFDALAFLMAGKMSFNEYLSLLRRYYGEQDYLPAYEVSEQLVFLYSIAPSRFAEISREFYLSQLRILGEKVDENSSMLRGIMAGRLAMVDDSYAKEVGSKFYDYDEVEPDMKEAVAMAYARAYGNFEEIVKKYRKSSSDEERVRLLNSTMSFKETSLVALSLGLALSGEVKRQDVRTMLVAAIGNPSARDTVWTWMKVNMGRLRKLYDGTGVLSRTLLSTIPVVGIGKVEEVKKFFEENRIPEAEKGIVAALEKLEIYDRLAKKM